MTNLLPILNRIVLWINRYYPNFPEFIPPSLELSKVSLNNENIESVVPNDFLILHQWCCNSKQGFHRNTLGPNYYLFSFDEIFEYKNSIFPTASSTDRNQTILQYKKNPVLPFIKSDCDHYAIILNRDFERHAHIVLLNEVGEARLVYDSITTMMGSILACFEAQAYYLNNQGHLEVNEFLMSEILRENNPKVVEETVNDLRRSIQNYIANILRTDAFSSPTDTSSDTPSAITVYSYEDWAVQDDYSNCRAAILALAPFRSPKAVTVLREVLIELEKVQSVAAERTWSLINLWLQEIMLLP